MFLQYCKFIEIILLYIDEAKNKEGVILTKLLIKLFIKDYENTSDKKVREHYCVLSGVLGMICNTFLFIVKLIIGVSMSSIAIISDAINNLSDTGSSIVSIVGAKLSNMKPDKEHPYGHGRFEYISSFIVAVLIMVVGIELFKSSIDKIQNPSTINFSIIMIVILLFSLLIKLWMFFYNKYIGKKISSNVLIATAQDSINDVISTSAVILSTTIGYYLDIQIDGYIGLIVSCFVMYSGFKIAKDTVNTLLGEAPSAETVKDIEDLVLSGKGVIGVHDLFVHDYGPGRVMASIHAEVPNDVDVVKIHEVIDSLEKMCMEKFNINLVIHMDPIFNKDKRVNELKEFVQGIISGIDERLSIHDFRITDGEHSINLIFDLVIPFDYSAKKRIDVLKKINDNIKEKDERYNSVINIDNG